MSKKYRVSPQKNSAANQRSLLKSADNRRRQCPGKTCRQVERRALARRNDKREPLKTVVMEFELCVGAVLRRLHAVALKACANTERGGNFKFQLGGRPLEGLASLGRTGKSLYVQLGDFTVGLPAEPIHNPWCEVTISAGTLLCYGRRLGEMVVHLCNFASSLGEIETGRLRSTWPARAVPSARDDDTVHIETARHDAVPRTATTPRFYITPSFARWLDRQRFG